MSQVSYYAARDMIIMGVLIGLTFYISEFLGFPSWIILLNGLGLILGYFLFNYIKEKWEEENE